MYNHTTPRQQAAIEKLDAALRSTGSPTFAQHTGGVYDAQRALNGKTHYVETSTLKYFKARVETCGGILGGLMFFVIERVGSKPADIPGGNVRLVIFDVFGSQVDREGVRDVWHRNENAAWNALDKLIKGGMDTAFAIRHTRDRMRERAARLRREAATLTKAAR